MSPFTSHGITHLSASQLSTFCADPSFWMAQKVFGLRTPASFAMERGKAVETGIVAGLKGACIEDATEAAFRAFDEAGQYGGLTGDAEKERDAIPGMVVQGIEALVDFGTPDFPADGTQHRIEFNIRFGEGEYDVIPLIGFLDLVYEDRIIDIKSTLRVPSEMSLAHRIQAAIYSRSSGNKDIAFCYISPKKSALLRPENIAADQQLVRNIVKRMAAFLALGNSETLRAAVPVILDSWSWRGLENDRQKYLGV
jgi:hypothetical protein